MSSGPCGQSLPAGNFLPPNQADDPAPDAATHLAPANSPAPRPRIGRSLSVRAYALDRQGAGLCQVAGLLLHVPGLLPDETADVLVTHISPHHDQGWATLRRRTAASPQRAIPICAGYGVCGGCSLQHLTYSAQLLWKREQLRTALQGLAGAAASVRDCVFAAPDGQSDTISGYRSRVKLVAASLPRDSTIFLGSYVPRTHTVVAMDGCRVHSAAIGTSIRSLTSALNSLPLPVYDEALAQGVVRYVLLRETVSGAQQLGLVVAEVPAPNVLSQLSAVLRQASPALVSIVLHHNRSRGNALLNDEEPASDSASTDIALYGPPYVWEEIGGIALRVSARSFLQVHRAMAARIYADVSQALAADWSAQDSTGSGPQILDVYCGVGGLGLTLLSQLPGSTLLGLEWSQSAISDAWASAEKLGVRPRVDFRCGAAEALLADPTLQAQARGVSVALLNPPRRGCAPALLSALLTLRPRRIAYVSCSPESLARDLQTLLSAGYRLQHSTPYDMHPGTSHVESVTLLVDTPPAGPQSA